MDATSRNGNSSTRLPVETRAAANLLKAIRDLAEAVDEYGDNLEKATRNEWDNTKSSDETYEPDAYAEGRDAMRLMISAPGLVLIEAGSLLNTVFRGPDDISERRASFHQALQNGRSSAALREVINMIAAQGVAAITQLESAERASEALGPNDASDDQED